MLDTTPPALLTCFGSKKRVSALASGHGQGPSLVKVRLLALFLVTELHPHHPLLQSELWEALGDALLLLVLGCPGHHGGGPSWSTQTPGFSHRLPCGCAPAPYPLRAAVLGDWEVRLAQPPTLMKCLDTCGSGRHWRGSIEWRSDGPGLDGSL